MDKELLLNEPQPSAPKTGYDYGPPHLPPPVDYPVAQGVPPPPPYEVPAGAPSIQTVILNQQVIYGTTPAQVRCPNCQKDIITNIHYDTGMLTWISVLVLFLLGFWPCCLIPLCIDALKDVTHTCPNCGHICGQHKRIG